MQNEKELKKQKRKRTMGGKFPTMSGKFPTEKEIEIEKEIEKEPEKEGENRIDYQEIVSLYNDTCVSFPKVPALSEAIPKGDGHEWQN